MNPTDRYCTAIHTLTDKAQDGLGYFLDLLKKDRGGWSPETLAMIHLENDAKQLRALADRIDAERERLTREESCAA